VIEGRERYVVPDPSFTACEVVLQVCPMVSFGKLIGCPFLRLSVRDDILVLTDLFDAGWSVHCQRFSQIFRPKKNDAD
jgi:hypothetical protein